MAAKSTTLHTSASLSRGGEVALRLDESQGAATALVVLGHGAGADMLSPFMERFASGLAGHGLAVARFRFPYMERMQREGRRRPPDRAPVLLDCFADVLTRVDELCPGMPLFVGGKSMGGRIASMLAAEGRTSPRGLVFLGYPLHPSGRPERLRAAHLPRMGARALFVQGDRDPLCDLALLRHERRGGRVPGRLHVVKGGDHSFRQLAARRDVEDAEFEKAQRAIARFVAETLRL